MSVSPGWPGPLRKAFEAACYLVRRIDLLHLGLMLAQPRHAQIVVENLSKLDHCLCCEAEGAIPPIESALMGGRGNQAFCWPVLSIRGNQLDVVRTRQFTSAHRAVMILARNMVHDVLSGMKPNVILIPRLPDTDDEGAWNIAYLEVTQSCKIMEGEDKAGPEWQSFCARYRDQDFLTVWPPSAAEDLVTMLQLEANAAAQKWPGPGTPFLHSAARAGAGPALMENIVPQTQTKPNLEAATEYARRCVRATNDLYRYVSMWRAGHEWGTAPHVVYCFLVAHRLLFLDNTKEQINLCSREFSQARHARGPILDFAGRFALTAHEAAFLDFPARLAVNAHEAAPDTLMALHSVVRGAAGLTDEESEKRLDFAAINASPLVIVSFLPIDVPWLNDQFKSRRDGICSCVLRDFAKLDTRSLAIELEWEAANVRSSADPIRQTANHLPKARTLLTGWKEITDALEMRYNDRGKIKRLNQRLSGPIQDRGKGTQPMVYQDNLFDWWNMLAIQQKELANQREGASLSAKVQHNYGRKGTVAPEIGGSVKKRRT